MPKKVPKIGDHPTRVGLNFINEINEIQKQRLDLGVDKKKKSVRRLTNLLVRHKLWPKIKEEMIEVDLEERIENE